MAKRGRPRKTNNAKNRIHSVIFNEKAELVYRKVCRQRNKKNWLHRYISEHIIRDFGGGAKAIHLYELLDLQRQRDTLEIKIQEIAHKVSKLEATEKEKIIKREITKQVRR